MKKNQEQFWLCPTDGGYWYRLYSVYEVDAVPHIFFVGHLPRAYEAIAHSCGRDLKTQRYPKLRSVLMDLRGIALSMGYEPQQERVVLSEVVSERPGRRNLRIRVNGQTRCFMKIRQKSCPQGMRAKRLAHLCGPLDALLETASAECPETFGHSEAIQSETAEQGDFGSLKLWRFELYGREEWSRLWATFKVGERQIVTYLGHYADPSFMRATCPQSQKHFASQRPPRTSAIASDIVTLAMKTSSMRGAPDTVLLNVCHETENATHTKLRVRARSGETLSRLQMVSSTHSDGEIKSVVKGGIMGPMAALLRLVDGLSIKEVRLNPVMGFGLHAV